MSSTSFSVEERLTPFMIFFCEQKSLIGSTNLKPYEISSLIYEKWKKLAPEQSRAYSVLSATYAESKKSGPVPTRRKRTRDKDPKAPKAATSAYMYFSKHHRNLLKQENTELSFGDLGKTVGAMWKAATAEEKQPFEERAAVDKTRYLSQLADFKKENAAALEVDEAAKRAKEAKEYGMGTTEADIEEDVDDDDDDEAVVSSVGVPGSSVEGKS